MPSELKVVSLCSYLTETSIHWRPEDYSALKMVKALKGDELNGYFDAIVSGTRKQFNSANIDEFVKLIPKAMCKTILAEINGNATIVPIPNSGITDPRQQGFKTLGLAEDIARHSGGRLTAIPALVFKKQQQKSRDGGPRSPYHFESEYKIARDVSGPIVLVDDVVTGGGHLIGACWKLKNHKRNIVLACTFGCSTKGQLPQPLSVRSQMLCLVKNLDVV